MAEHDSDREDREGREDQEAREAREARAGRGRDGSGPEHQDQDVPFDEDAAWKAIVAGYGDEPPDPSGAKPFKSVEDLALLESDTNTDTRTEAADDGAPAEAPTRAGDKPVKPLGGSVAFAPGVGGPRDYSVSEPSENDFDDGDEGHFVPPEPPPLPETDVTSKFAWLGVLGGPVLLLLAVLLGWEMTWWLTTLCIGGFLGGFATLVMRMRTDDEDDDPGRGAVV
ncbi:hypothetical protein OH738_29800 [Streptomyces hirsutus]|uniref:DUF308 domain-containing protein n=1 Tax=Streptomyces hirsutus TaxID=35620 RepID=A0ABZ1GIR7_9ACTN|nr:hypothetical protein [Streptomyces hirsutus]WSD06046.1 hypothetical protein OIE73_09865 [Streptomyces hirsutus]WTD20537.1 hypothetical protein OH738_29800 [Streptomyces hirsutus]